jgi:hypothetical protein
VLAVSAQTLLLAPAALARNSVQLPQAHHAKFNVTWGCNQSFVPVGLAMEEDNENEEDCTTTTDPNY